MDIPKITKSIASNWSIAWKMLLAIVIAAVAVTKIYASVNNRLDNQGQSIACINEDNKIRDLKLEEFQKAMIRQTVQYENICKTLERIEKQLERLESENVAIKGD